MPELQLSLQLLQFSPQLHVTILVREGTVFQVSDRSIGLLILEPANAQSFPNLIQKYFLLTDLGTVIFFRGGGLVGWYCIYVCSRSIHRSIDESLGYQYNVGSIAHCNVTITMNTMNITMNKSQLGSKYKQKLWFEQNQVITQLFASTFEKIFWSIDFPDMELLYTDLFNYFIIDIKKQ